MENPTKALIAKRLAALKPIDLVSRLKEAPKPIDEIFPGLRPGKLGLVVAAGGTGKGWLALDMCAAVAAGGAVAGGLFGPGTPGRAVLLTGEDDEAELMRRLRVIALERGDLAEDVLRRIDVIDATGEDISMMSGDLVLDEVMMAVLLELARGARLVIIDTLRRLHYGEERDSGAMTKLLVALEGIAKTSGAAIVLIHHAKKDGEGADASRGSTAITATVRWQMNLAGMTDDEAGKYEEMRARHGGVGAQRYVRFSLPKSNYTAPIESEWLFREQSGYLRVEGATQPCVLTAAQRARRLESLRALPRVA